MGNLIAKTEVTTSADEKQVRNGLDHARVYDPNADRILTEILHELRVMNTQLQLITDTEIESCK